MGGLTAAGATVLASGIAATSSALAGAGAAVRNKRSYKYTKKLYELQQDYYTKNQLAAYNYQMAMANHAYNKEMEQWQRENQYNSPAAQMERYKAAGLNPNLIYGQSNPSAGSPSFSYGGAPSGWTPSGQYTVPENPLANLQLGDIANNALNTYYDIRQKNLSYTYETQKINNIKLQNKLLEIKEDTDYVNYLERAAQVYSNIDKGIYGKRLENEIKQLEFDEFIRHFDRTQKEGDMLSGRAHNFDLNNGKVEYDKTIDNIEVRYKQLTNDKLLNELDLSKKQKEKLEQDLKYLKNQIKLQEKDIYQREQDLKGYDILTDKKLEGELLREDIAQAVEIGKKHVAAILSYDYKYIFKELITGKNFLEPIFLYLMSDPQVDAGEVIKLLITKGKK